jgi:hypothetical protein
LRKSYHAVPLDKPNPITGELIEVMAGFPLNLSVPALLGRHGFFDHFLVTFDHSTDPPMIEVVPIDRPS